MKDIIARIQNNKKRVSVFVLISLGIVLGMWYLLTRAALIGPAGNTEPTPTPTSAMSQTERDLGFTNTSDTKTPNSITAEDPIKVPETVSVYKLGAGPEELFSTTNMPLLAQQFGFTIHALRIPGTNTYTFSEDTKRATFNKATGTVMFSTSFSALEKATTHLSPDEAKQRARSFLTQTGFANPLIDLNSSQVTLYEIIGNAPRETGSFPEIGYYKVTLPMKIGNSRLISPQEFYINVATNGSIAAARLWYPTFDEQNPETYTIISYLEALSRARNGQGIFYKSQISTDQDITFTKTDIIYFIPNDYFYGQTGETYVTIPTYEFTNADTTLYVSALP